MSSALQHDSLKRKMKNNSVFSIEGYLAVIPHIQNVYPPEKDKIGWTFGFKYTSGVFEFFTFKTLSEVRAHYNRLSGAINSYYSKETK